jgi:hypothetical protein
MRPAADLPVAKQADRTDAFPISLGNRSSGVDPDRKSGGQTRKARR